MKHFQLLPLLLFFMAISIASQGQTVTISTDKDDYWPGQWVIITGSGWQNDADVQLTLTHLDPLPDPLHTHESWLVQPKEDGSIYYEWFVEDQELGTYLKLTALGLTTSLSAETLFTDGNAASGNGTMTVSPVFVCGGGTSLSYTFSFDGGSGNKWNNGSKLTIDVPWAINSSNVSVSNIKNGPINPSVSTSTASSFTGGTLVTVNFYSTTNAPSFDVVISGSGVNMPASSIYVIPVATAQAEKPLVEIQAEPIIASGNGAGVILGSQNSCTTISNGRLILYGQSGTIVRWEKRELISLVNDTWTDWTTVNSAGNSDSYNLNGSYTKTTQFRVLSTGASCSLPINPGGSPLYYSSELATLAITSAPEIIAQDINNFSSFTVAFGQSVNVNVFSLRPAIVHYYINYGTSDQLEIHSPYTFNAGSTTVTVAATNSCHEIPVIGTFKVNTGIAPQINCPATIIQPTDDGVCSAKVSYDVSYESDLEATLANGFYSGIPQPTISYNTDGGSVYTAGTGSSLDFAKGTTTVYLKASNAAGVAYCNFNVTVEDKQAPVLADESITSASLDKANLNWCLSGAQAFEAETLEDDIADLYKDNCPGDISVTLTSTTAPESPVNSDCAWSLTYLYTVSDVAGNKTTSSVTYSGGDKSAPELVDPLKSAETLNITLVDECLSAADSWDGAQLEAAVAALYKDNCDNAVEASLTDKVAASDNTNCSWSFTYTYTVTDNCSNTVTCNVIRSGGDKTGPSLTGTAYAGTTGTNACMVIAETVAPFNANDAIQGYTDNCGADVTAELTGTEVAGTDCDWTVTYTFKVVDACGNALPDQKYSNTGSDQTAPSLTGTAYAGTTGANACKANAETAAPFNSNDAIQGYTDNCGADVTAELTGTEVTGTDCDWTVTYTFKVLDACGNALLDQKYSNTGSDQTAPSLTGTAYAGTTGTNACMADAEAAVPAFSEALAIEGYSDNCGGTVSAELIDTQVTGTNCDWTVTYYYTVLDACNNPLAEQSYSHSGSDQTAPIVSTKDISMDLGSNGEVTIADNAVDNGSIDGCGENVTLSLSQTEFDCTDLGPNPVTLTVTDACNNANTGDATVTIYAPTVTVAKVSAEKARYMDEVTLYAEIESYCGISNLTGTVEFFLDGVSVGTTEAWPIPAGEVGNPNKLRATMLYKFTNLPKTNYEITPWEITAKFTTATPYYKNSRSGATNLFIYPREADPFNSTTGFYTGNILAWTTGPNSSTGTITMAATIKDNIPGGDVRGAMVTFCYYNGSTLTPIPSAKNIPVGLINMTDGSIGIASADVQIDIAKATSQDYRIAVVVTGGYTNQPLSNDSYAMVTVAKPVLSGSIFGAGLIDNTCSEGQIRGAVGEKTEFSYDVSYNKKMTNPQGRMTVTIQSWYNAKGILDGKMHTYIIKSNAINLFVTNQVASTTTYTKPTAGQAIFEAKANLSEQFEDGSVVNIEGNSPLKVTMTDSNSNVDDGTETIAINYFRSSGGLWFTSCLSKEVTLATTESTIVVKTTTGLKSADVYGDIAPAVVFEPTLKAYPNPFTEKLNIEFSYEMDTQAKLEIYNITGAKLQTLYDGPVTGGQLYNFEYLPRLVSSQVVFYHLTLDGKTQVGKILFNERR